MKEVKMFMTETCPHCKKAFMLMEKICAEHPEYKAINIEKIDESKDADYAAKFDYYYIPTYYIDGVKVHEGATTREIIERVYAQAFSSDS